MVTNPILQMFARSPFTPMQEHIAKAQECAAELTPFLHAVIAEDWDKAAEIQQQITQLENEADALKRKIRRHLPGNLFLPVPRSDLLELLRMQDKIANKSRDIAGPGARTSDADSREDSAGDAGFSANGSANHRPGPYRDE